MMMKKILILCFVFISFYSMGQHKVRNREVFNYDWLFSKGENIGAQNLDYDDSAWRELNLPHDWAIEGPFDEKHDARTGGLPISGVAWYRKHFNVDSESKGKKITIEFDGVMNNSTVYINGHQIGERPYGYIGFEVDLTPYIKYDEENVIALHLAPEELSSRWYPGAGIYRNVWMEIKNKTHIAHWGTYVTTPSVTDQEATINIETIINCDDDTESQYQVRYIILDADNAIITEEIKEINPANNGISVNTTLQTVGKPIRWDLDRPYLYTLKTEILKDNKVLDDYFTTFGIRTISYSSDGGFKLNGRQERFRGVCLHHDLGPLGAAVNTRATERQLEIMKAMGVNAIRTSHNPPSPEQLALCDKMGILVQVEAFDGWKMAKVENDYSVHWDEWHETDLRDIIRRDRNHPSVIMWSIGNEMKEQRRPHGGAMAQQLTDICHDEDPTRPTTAGFNAYPDCVKNGLAAGIDIVGLNYKPTQYNHFLNNNSDAIVYGSETSSCVSSRGIYHLPIENYDTHESKQITSYDIISPPWAYPPDFEIEAQNTMPRSLGEFIWTGFDYLGEPTPFNGRDNATHGRWTGDWPSRSSYFGAVDLCGFPKDRFYFYQSVWTEKPMVHILPHWNWEGEDIDTIPVYCYTNGDEAELFLNGNSLGRKRMGEDKTTIPSVFNWWKKPQKTWNSPYRLNWDVPYKPGILEVKAYRDGKLIAENKIETAGKPYQIRLIADRKKLNAKGNDLSFVTVRIEDKKGILVPNADNLVHFEIEGVGRIVAVGNGNAATTESFQANHRKAFSGLCMLIVGTKRDEAGTIKVKAVSEGLKSMTTVLESK